MGRSLAGIDGAAKVRFQNVHPAYGKTRRIALVNGWAHPLRYGRLNI
ncbi:MAG: hypothetical protein LCI00_19400 [Chloroflexi bacterium]|nr:hypothetical protein [Chloroflexota bacterium]